MRFARALAGMLLLTIGIPALLAGAALWLIARHADPGGGFGARFETLRTPGNAVVVGDLGQLLRRETPFTRTGPTGLRLTARTPDGPAFLGIARSDEVRRWLGSVPHATVDRLALSRGPLPVRLDQPSRLPAVPGPSGAAVPGSAAVPGAVAVPSAAVPGAAAPAPGGQPFWRQQGVGTLQWDPHDLGSRSYSLVVMRPDGRADLALDLHAEVRPGWLAPATGGLLSGGVLLVALAVLVFLRPVRPREVVFVVEPEQVPVLASRLGVRSLSALGGPGRDPGDPGDDPAARPALAAVGVADRPRPAIAATPAGRPASLADLPPGSRLITSVGAAATPVRAAVTSVGAAATPIGAAVTSVRVAATPIGAASGRHLDQPRRTVRRRILRRGAPGPAVARRPDIDLAWPPMRPEETGRPVPTSGPAGPDAQPGDGPGGGDRPDTDGRPASGAEQPARRPGPGPNPVPAHEATAARRPSGSRPAGRSRPDRG